MHEVLREYLHRIVLVYIDDILIYTRSMAEHRHHVAEVLKRLRELHLFLKAEKRNTHSKSSQTTRTYNICVTLKDLILDRPGGLWFSPLSTSQSHIVQVSRM